MYDGHRTGRPPQMGLQRRGVKHNGAYAATSATRLPG